MRFRPFHGGEQIERRALARCAVRRCLAATTLVSKRVSNAGTITTPDRNQHRVAATHPFASDWQIAIASNGEIGLTCDRRPMAQHDPRKWPITARTETSDNDTLSGISHRDVMYCFAQRWFVCAVFRNRRRASL